jgi:hypothetical protein
MGLIHKVQRGKENGNRGEGSELHLITLIIVIVWIALTHTI